MNSLFEGQLERKTGERSTENATGEPEPGPGSRVTGRSQETGKEHSLSRKHYDSLFALKTIYISIVSGNKHMFIAIYD